MYTIQINSSSRYPIDRSRIRAVITSVLEKEQLGRSTNVSVAFVGKRKAKQLNIDYRDKDYIPNVLSFPYQDDVEGFIFPDNGQHYLGDMVICYPIAVEQAGQQNILVDDWIDQLVTHSMEHLLGRHHD